MSVLEAFKFWIVEEALVNELEKFGVPEKLGAPLKMRLPENVGVPPIVPVSVVKFAFVAKRLVEVALTVSVLEAFKFVIVEEAPIRVAKIEVPVNVGDALNTAFPVPVSSVRSARSSAEVSIEVVETFSANCLKLSAERRPLSVVEATSGMLRV